MGSQLPLNVNLSKYYIISYSELKYFSHPKGEAEYIK
jgi:hypothetical protein